ncbi:CDP-diacylglycerol--glycerol-3-phosphate 3-phosphatidyltransferase [bacterium BMS3Bbin01]|nr:CDP-diacylglycerol--glycerol-3-phosphate 3-phosphatidyltransferase [bacterium BMS3Bbin01]
MLRRGAGTLILTIPNLISTMRLLGVGLFAWLAFARGESAAAGWLLLLIGWSDWIDGYLARRLNQVSELGKVLDPLADRLAIATAVIGGMFVDVIPLSLGIAIALREVLVGVGALFLAGHGRRIDVRPLGKLATFILYGAIPAFYVSHGTLLPSLFAGIAWSFGVVGLVLYWWVGVLYVGDARRAL